MSDVADNPTLHLPNKIAAAGPLPVSAGFAQRIVYVDFDCLYRSMNSRPRCLNVP